MDENKHEIVTGFKNHNEIDLIKFLEKNKQRYWIRQVIVPNFTDDKNNLIELKEFLDKLKYMDNFELLPYHELALSKYKKLNIKYLLKNKTHVPLAREMLNYKKMFNIT
jgi:pyruvate formate lyase activating enzyme